MKEYLRLANWTQFKTQQELNITPKPTKNNAKETLKATQAKQAKEAKNAKRLKRLQRLKRPNRLNG